MSTEKTPAGVGKIALMTAAVFAFGGFLVGMKGGVGFAVGTGLAAGVVGLVIGAVIGAVAGFVRR
jgi:hypothetical protein